MQASEGHTHSHQTRNIPLDSVWWIYPMHHGPDTPCWAAARSTPSCKDGGARMARALQAEGGDGLVAGLAGRPRSNGLRWAGAPHSLAPRSSCCRNAQAHVAAVAVRPKSPHESPQLLEVKSPVIKRRMVGGWCRRGLRCAAGAGAPIG